jgi:shikimate dehydrogenase
MTSHLVGLIGSGIGPSLSPALREREADHHGLRYLYRTIDIADLGLDAGAAGCLVRTARRFGYTGLNITHPCKQTVIEHLDELAPEAATLGAVNTVTFEAGRAVGHNTDWTGFARGLPGAPTRRIVQLGAGGAGSAVAHALLALGAERVDVVDEREERAAALVAALSDSFGADRAGVNQDLAARRRRPGQRDPGRHGRPPRPALALFTGVEPDAERTLAHLADLVNA